jgi:hypothetical protein
MLARIFTGPEAISVWVELVQKQKDSIRKQEDDGLYPREHQGALSAAQQDIPRSDLANWDASARAWLQSADQAKAIQHTQTMLIFNNISVPVSTVFDTHSSVLRAWTSALEAMNELVKGVPQGVQDGATLLAISSWHLYPNIHYAKSSLAVPQKDSIFKDTAILTLGLQQIRGDDSSKSVYWSLPLACLQYYGEPTKAARAVGQDNSRITYDQFPYIILGCLFAGWGPYASENERGLYWVEKLASALGLALDRRYERNHRLSWLIYLLAAAQDFVECSDIEQEVSRRLMKLGNRQSSFLHMPIDTPAPLFGLSQIEVLLPLLKSDEARIEFLRQLCQFLSLDQSQYLIRITPQNPAIEAPTEYASIQRSPPPSLKREHDGNLKETENFSKKHIRWMLLSNFQLMLCIKRKDDLIDTKQAKEKLQELERIEREDYVAKVKDLSRQDCVFSDSGEPRSSNFRELRQIISISERRQAIEVNGELCLPFGVYNRDRYRHESESGLIFPSHQDFFMAAMEILKKRETVDSVKFAQSATFYVGDADLAALCFMSPTYSISLMSAVKSLSRYIVSPRLLETALMEGKFDKERLTSHLSGSLHAYKLDEITSLKACAMMSQVYKLLPGATISTLVVNKHLPDAKWIPKPQVHSDMNLSLQQAFACIAMFESGTCNLDPNTLSEAFAMSSGSSLYVAGSLLCDPYEQPGPAEIHRVMGNIGRPGITFLICPPEPKIRKPDPEKWQFINHRPYDGKLENYFEQTSMHLSFTEYVIPLITEDNPRHIIDRDVQLIEALIRVYDGGTWVGEVDILKTFRSKILRSACENIFHFAQSEDVTSTFTSSSKRGTYELIKEEYPNFMITSVENWHELVEAPSRGIIAVRAHKNRLARLATTAVCVRHGFELVVLDEHTCWGCLGLRLKDMVKCNDKLALIC